MSEKRKFLVIDDDCDDTDLFTEAVAAVDASILCQNAIHGRQALEKLTGTDDERPDIIFLDINMPIMNGWQFLSKIKQSEKFKTIPVIMYSTSSKRADVDTAMSSGALCFFTKPTSFLRLKNILEIVVNHLEKDDLQNVCKEIAKA